MRRAASGAAVVMLVAGLGACSSSATGTSGYGGQGSAASSVPPSTVRLTAADNGRRVSVAAGARLVLTLNSTYWQVAPLSSATLSRRTVATHPRKSHIPGMGSGTVVATYRAGSAGRAVVAAYRSSCGEALRCSASQSHFRVTVIVQ
jgi:hypothetical protein